MDNNEKTSLVSVQSFDDLKFFIKADWIMNGYGEVPLFKRLCHIEYLKRFLIVLRITEWLYNTMKNPIHRLRWIPYFFFRRYLDRLSYKCGFSIPINTLGYGVHLAHHGTCVINSSSHIGRYCAILIMYVLVTEIPKTLGKDVGFPQVLLS